MMTSMRRDFEAQLLAWRNSERRKPLIVNGARQVGKTYSLLQFAKRYYENYLYVNFEQDKRLADFFADNLDAKLLLSTLSIYGNCQITPGRTLIIFDEVQSCPRALTSLKYFCENANEYHVAAAGSLLGVKLANPASFPVGKVNFLHLYPMSFYEFLDAIGEDKLRVFLTEQRQFTPLPELLHQKALDTLRYYLYVGGMPESVAQFAKGRDVTQVRSIQLDILEAYLRDFAKHAPGNQVMNITTIWQQLPPQLAKENKKFIFSAIRKSARAREYETAIQWLIDAGLAYKCQRINKPHLPLAAYVDAGSFKLFLFDVGLLGAASHLNPRTLINGDQLFTEFKGALMENYVAQVLKQGQFDLFYWVSNGSAEVDFVVAYEQTLYPLEVKAGSTSKKKSLKSYGERYDTSLLSRTTPMNLAHHGNIDNYPLYLLENFPLQREN